MQTIDPKRFRSVMGTFPTGVAVITTTWNGELFGATINSLTSVSLQPSMLLFLHKRGQRDRSGHSPARIVLGQYPWPTSIRPLRPLYRTAKQQI